MGPEPVIIADATLYRGDCLDVLPALAEAVQHHFPFSEI